MTDVKQQDSRLDADRVKTGAEGRARELLPKLGISTKYLTGKHGPCPACGGKDRFRFDDRQRHGDYYCNQCGAGDLFSLTMKVNGWSFPETVEAVAHALGLATEGKRKADFYAAYQAPLQRREDPENIPEPSDRSDKAERPKRRDRRRRAFRIWRETVPIQGTLAETYLHNRGLSLPPDCDALRFHPKCPVFNEHHPAMIGLFRSARTGLPWAIHITPLTPDGHRIKRIGKPTLGGSKGCIIKISPDEAVTTGLGLTEGIETALAVLQTGWAPVWAAGNTSLMGSFPILPGIEALSLFADHDGHEAGMKAARKAAERWAAAGRETTIIAPRKVGTDWADMIEKGAA